MPLSGTFQPSSHAMRKSRLVPRILLLACAYFLAGWFGLSMPYYGSFITLVWLPTGIAVAAVLLWGARVWPGIALGAIFANLAAGASLPLSVCFAVGNTLAPLITTLWLRHSGFRRSFERRNDVFALVVGAALGMTASALGGTATLYFFGVISAGAVGVAWIFWWMGDTIGVLLGAPLLISLTRKNLSRLKGNGGELIAWFVVALPIASFAFLQPQEHVGRSLPMVFLTLPLLAWASLRFGLIGSTVAGAGFSVLAAIGTAKARGTFFLPETQTSLFVLWGYMSIIALSGLLLTALLAERHVLENSRRDIETKLRGMYELSPLGFVLMDIEGRIIEFNESFRAMFGYLSEELKTLDYWALTGARSRAGDRQQFRDLIRTGQYGPFEAEYVRKDGDRVPLQFTGMLINGADGERYSWSIVENIAERRRIQADLRIAATAFEAQVSMFVTDPNAVILRVNRAFTDDTGYTAEEAVGQTPKILRSGRHDSGFYAHMWNSILRKGTWEGEIWDRRKNGEIYPNWMTISAVTSEDGQVTNYVATRIDITHRKAAEEEIRSLAFYDSLTRQPNRRLFRDRLQHAIANSARSNKCGALFFIDLDHFKTLNDTLGHSQGDLLLQQVAERLAGLVRQGDTVARFGGDEFVILFEELGTTIEEAASMSEVIGKKILEGLRKVYVLGGHDYTSTASVGITLFGPVNEGVEELLKQADLAMYQAKAAGRNRLRFFDPKMQQVATDHLLLESNLRNALRDQQFVVHYQAQVDVSGRPSGAEVLVRWLHPTRGLVYPDEFVPLAEETGMILPLGQWVLEVACEQLVRWARLPDFAHLSLAVNVSGHQVRQSDFVEQVLLALERSGANPHKLKLELTESLLMSNIEDAIAKMSALSARGVGFALDDFGTGYSSLSHLKRLPLQCLKIDRSFVKDVLTDPNDAAIARTVIALANSLGLDVLAEGVETVAQKDFLAASGCFAYQGYLFSRPIPLESFESYLRGFGGSESKSRGTDKRATTHSALGEIRHQG